MASNTQARKRNPGCRARAFLLAALIALLGSVAFAGPAKAAPFSMDLTNGQLNLGFAFKGAEILPAPATLGDPPAPLPDLWEARDTLPATCLAPWLDPPANTIPNPNFPCGPNPPDATVSGDITGSDVTVTSTAGVPGLPSGFRFPIMVVPNPLDNSPVPVTIAATGNVTGTWNGGTGELSLDGPIEARVLVGLTTNPLGEYCALPLPGLVLSTTSNDDFPGVPFSPDINGTGALTGTYNITDDATSIGGADCSTVDQVSKGTGSIWLSNGIEEPPVCPEFTTGIPPDCEPIPCPPGFTGNEPDCVKVQGRIANIKVKLKNRRLKAGKKSKVLVTVRNGGNAKMNAKIRMKSSNRFVKVPKRVVIKNLRPGGRNSKTAKVTVRVKRKAKGKKVAITARGGNQKGKLKVKIR